MDKNEAGKNLLGKIIDLMRAEGWEVDSPYDFDNFVDDHCSHSDMFKTGRFDDLEEE